MVEGKRTSVREGGGAWTADSPRTLFDLTEIFDEVGLTSVVTGYLGERPALSVSKGTLRRVPLDTLNAEWHQDGAFLGKPIRTLNVWLALSQAGVDSPGLDLLPRRLDGIVETGTEGAIFPWTVAPAMVEQAAQGTPICRPTFEPGDALLFDELFLHRTAYRTGDDARAVHDRDVALRAVRVPGEADPARALSTFLPPGAGTTLDRLPGGTFDVLERERVQPPEVQGIVVRWLVPHAADRLVVGVHVVPGEPAGGRGPSVVLVEGRLAEEHDELDRVEAARPSVQVVVREPAAREREPFVEPAELGPDVRPCEEAAALAHRAEQAPARGAAGRADLEQLIAVVLPRDAREEVVFDHLVVAHLVRPHVRDGAEVEGGCRHERPPGTPCCPPGAVEQTGGHDPRSVDEEPHEVTSCEAETVVRGADRRRRGRVQALEAQVPGERLRQPGVDRWVRPVVDHDDLVRVGVDPVLTVGSERRQRAGELTGHVVDDDDDAQAHHGTARSTPGEPTSSSAGAVSWIPLIPHEGPRIGVNSRWLTTGGDACSTRTLRHSGRARGSSTLVPPSRPSYSAPREVSPMPYVMVPVPEEHVQDVMQFVVRMASQATLEPWTQDEVAQLFDEIDEPARALLSAVAKGVIGGNPLNEADAAAIIGMTWREVTGMVRELNEAAASRSHPALVGRRSVTTTLPNGRTRDVRALIIDDEVAPLVHDADRAQLLADGHPLGAEHA